MEFDDNSVEYKLFTLLHIKYVGIFCGLIGIVTTVIAFCLGVTYFPWSHYETSFDVVALTGLLIFLFLSVAVHYMILHAVRFTKSQLLVPFLIYHAFLISLNAITTLIAAGELVADQGSKPSLIHSSVRVVFILVPSVIIVQVLMIVVVVKLRLYLKNKRRHIRNGQPPPVCGVICPTTVRVIQYNNKNYTDRSQNDMDDHTNSRTTKSASSSPFRSR